MNQLKNKYEIIIGIVTLILSYSAFKDNLIKFSINIGNFNLNLADYFLYCVIGLSISIYFFIIEKLFSEIILKPFKVFDYLIIVAYSIFCLIFISPILLFIGILFFEGLDLFKSYAFKNEVTKIDDKEYLFIYSLLLIQGFYIAIRLANSIIKRSRENEISILEEKQIKELEKAIKLYKDEYYCQSIFESFKVLDSSIKSKVLASNLRLGKTIEINLNNLIKEKILTEVDIENINNLRNLRNQIAHDINIECSKENAQNAFILAEKIIKKLDN